MVCRYDTTFLQNVSLVYLTGSKRRGRSLTTVVRVTRLNFSHRLLNIIFEIIAPNNPKITFHNTKVER